MQPADAPATDDPGDRSSKNPISVAILAAVACVPIVIAMGFLTDRWPRPSAAVPGDASALALRGPLDGSPEDRPIRPARAGY